MAQPDDAPDYLRYVAHEAPGNEDVLLRWPKSKMPLRIYLPPAPAAYFDDPEEMTRRSRRGVLDWTDAAGPGLPSFELVETAGEADFPIAWGDRSPDRVVAHCFYDVDLLKRRFGVAQVVVFAKTAQGQPATPLEIYSTLLHEMGHALGLGGHSPNPDDVMYGFIRAPREGSLLEGRVLAPRRGGLTDRDRATLRALYARPIGARQPGAKRAY